MGTGKLSVHLTTPSVIAVAQCPWLAQGGQKLSGLGGLYPAQASPLGGPWEVQGAVHAPSGHGVTLAPLSQPARGTGAPQAPGGLAPALLVLLTAQLI